jgi:hypothetical protein
LIHFTALAQRPDQNWPLGINEFPGSQEYGNAVVRFLPDTLMISPVSWKMNFEGTVGAISDSIGNLLLMTNGCYVANGKGDTLVNGAGLNPGTIHDWVCPENGYPAPRGAMILPAPGGKSHYYIFHMGLRYEAGRQMTMGPLYYSLADMSKGKGEMLIKNKVLEVGDIEPFSVVRHGNGRDWWIIAPEKQTNRYFRFLLSPTGIETLSPLNIGPAGDCLRFGSTVFSPDGRRFARHENCRTTAFNFDRCTGLLSDPIVFSLPKNTFGGGGAIFSEDGNTLIVNTQLAIFSAELNMSNPVLDTLIPLAQIAGVGIHYMQRASNGNVYFSLMHRGKTFPSLQLRSGSFTYTQKGLTLPVFAVKSIPHFPNFQLYDWSDAPCDTLGITSVASIADKPQVTLHPNPVLHTCFISLENVAGFQTGFLTIYNSSGQMIKNQTVSDKKITIDTENWLPGIYFWRIYEQSGNFYGGKFMKL